METHPNEKDIFAAITGVKLPISEFDFGNGILFRHTYAHVFGLYMVATRPPLSQGTPHPGPWKSIGGGIAIDIWHELVIANNTKLFQKIDNLNTVWVIAHLMRLRLSPFITVPVISDTAFSEINNSSESVSLYPIETSQGNLFYSVASNIPDITELDWIKKNYVVVGKLLESNDRFALVFHSLDRAITDSRFSLALITLWGAIEQIFSPDDKQELSYRVSLNIAAYIEERGPERLKTFKNIRKLYHARSRAAHGSPSEDKEEFVKTYDLLRRIFFKMVEDGKVPTQADFEGRVMA